MTGREPIDLGLAFAAIRAYSDAGLPQGVPTIAELLKGAGYQTWLVGKWHLGHARPEQHPLEHGFEHFYGQLNGMIDYWTHERFGGLDWQRNGRSLREEGYATTLLGVESARLVRERDPSRPFFLYLPFNAPHLPPQAPEALLEEYRGRLPPERAVHAAMVEALDAALGELLTALEDEGIAGRTLVIFLSDNGADPDRGNNADLRGGKSSCFEGGIRVLGVARWPGVVPEGGQTDALVAVRDMLPTFAQAAGVPVPPDARLDGRSVWAALRGEALTGEARDLVCVREGPGEISAAILRDPYKLVVERRGAVETAALFDVRADPEESRDLLENEPELAAGLRRALDEALARHPEDGVRWGPPRLPGWEPPEDWAEAQAR